MRRVCICFTNFVNEVDVVLLYPFSRIISSKHMRRLSQRCKRKVKTVPDDNLSKRNTNSLKQKKAKNMDIIFFLLQQHYDQRILQQQICHLNLNREFIFMCLWFAPAICSSFVCPTVDNVLSGMSVFAICL